MFRLFGNRNQSGAVLSLSLFLQMFAFLQLAQRAFGYNAICFWEHDSEPLYPLYGMNVLMVDESLAKTDALLSEVIGPLGVNATFPEGYYQTGIHSKIYVRHPCDELPDHPNEGDWYYSAFGSSVFDYHCHFGYIGLSGYRSSPNHLLVADIETACHFLNGPTGLEKQVYIGVGVSLGICLLGCVMSRRLCDTYRRRERVRVEERLIAIMGDGSDLEEGNSLEERWNALEERVNGLAFDDAELSEQLNVLRGDISDAHGGGRCPISISPIRHPLRLECGHTYEASAIREWVEQRHHNKCPCCSAPANLPRAVVLDPSTFHLELEQQLAKFQRRIDILVFEHTACSSISSARSLQSISDSESSAEEDNDQRPLLRRSV